MTKKLLFVAVLGCGLIAARGMHAQTGIGGGDDDPCTGSPENPTLILGGLATGGFALSTLRTRIRARRSSSKAE